MTGHHGKKRTKGDESYDGPAPFNKYIYWD